MSVSINPLSIEQIRELADKDGSLYIINYTDRGRQRNRGVFHLSAVDESGASYAIVVPNTWIPIDLSMYGSVKQLTKSQSFINAFRNRDIIAISAEQAKSMLARPDAKEEAAKVDLKYNKTNVGIGSTETIQLSTGSSIDVNNLPQQPSEVAAKEDVLTKSDEALLELVDKFNKNHISDMDAVNALLAISPAPQDETLRNATMSINYTTSPFYLKLSELISAGPGEGKGAISDRVVAEFHQ